MKSDTTKKSQLISKVPAGWTEVKNVREKEKKAFVAKK